MKKPIALAAFDLDNTLLNDEHQIIPAVAAALRQLMEQGIVVCLATGRHFITAAQYGRELGLNGPLICYNGAMLRYAEAEQPIFVSYVQQELVREMAEFCHQRELYLQMYDQHNNLLVEKITEKTLADPDYYTTGCVEAGDLRQVAEFHTPKMMIYDEPERIAQLNAELSARYANRLYLAQSKDYLLEMMNSGVNKGAALSHLAASLNIGAEQVLACGDNSNDAEMLRWAGLGVAVANATPACQAAADYICQNPQEQGVLEALYKFVL